MKNRYALLLILSPLVLIFLSIIMGCGIARLHIPLNETDVSVVISRNFDTNKHRKVAVMPIYGDRKDGVLEAQASDVFAAKLMEMGFTVVERTQIQRIFNELQLSMSGALSKDELNKIGKLLDIDMIVMGTASGWNPTLEGYNAASIRFVDTVTGEQLISVWCNKIAGRKQYTPVMADSLKRKLFEQRR
jgi:hypothetical protein